LQTHWPWALQACLAPQAVQVPPLAPQAAVDAVTHWPAEQQPAQLAPPQLHAPPVQAWPLPQAPQALPPLPQALVDWAEAITHLPVASQQPFAQELGVQTQVPAAPHAWPLAQPPQAAPAVPQLVADWLA
jgi:hypothetical protein